jgi:hypothetical protein
LITSHAGLASQSSRQSSFILSSDSNLMQLNTRIVLSRRGSTPCTIVSRSSLVLSGFVVESAYQEDDRAGITGPPLQRFRSVFIMRHGSRPVHRHYRHHVTDLPLSGRIVQLVVICPTLPLRRCSMRASDLYRAPSPTTYWPPCTGAETRFASGQTNRCRISGAAPNCVRGNIAGRMAEGERTVVARQGRQSEPSGFKMAGAL